MKKCLIIGASGQIGTDIIPELQKKYGRLHVIASDIFPQKKALKDLPFEFLDATNFEAVKAVVKKYNINVIYHLAAILSAKGEENPKMTWDLNMISLLNVLNIAKEDPSIQIFWASSIAVFGPDTPKVNTPQNCIMNPTSIYGISKLSGELWCAYYSEKFGVDIRSLRFPGLIGYKVDPSGGTTDYATNIFHKILRGEVYTCFLKKDTYLPMMYISDAVKAIINIMDTDRDNIKTKSSYNISSLSFSPNDLFNGIKKQIPEVKIVYNPDSRQIIADSWPNSIDDSYAKRDWGWQYDFDLEKMIADIIYNLKKNYI